MADQLAARAHIIAPLFCWVVMSYLIENRPSFRYLIVIALPMQVLLAGLADGAVRALSKPALGHKLAGASLTAALVIALVAQAFGLGYTFVRTPGWQDDWQTLGKVIREQWQPGDVVLLNLYAPEIPIKLYLRGLPIDVLPDYRLKMSQTLTTDRARAWITSAYRRVWYASGGGRPIGEGNSADGILMGLHLRDHYVFDGRSNRIELRLFDTGARGRCGGFGRACPTARSAILGRFSRSAGACACGCSCGAAATFSLEYPLHARRRAGGGREAGSGGIKGVAGCSTGLPHDPLQINHPLSRHVRRFERLDV
ncbi:MAG: hypothetical protein HC853_12230, partial [Anaerolineae bacterium]|nr:hypothetical protein [Anaerolineae bacterium]